MRKGFTLVELSIVLVIIGLLIGGVLVGQNMTNVTRVTGQIAQIQQFDAGVAAFRNIYKGLPGDATSAGGDGDGAIDTGPPYAQNYIAIFACEIGNFWFSMDPVQYPGGSVCSAAGSAVKPISTGSAKNVPEGKMGKAGSIFIASAIADSYGSQIADTNLRNYYALLDRSDPFYDGSWIRFTKTSASNSSTKASELAALDKKIDDGLADKGNVISGSIGDYASGVGAINAAPLAACSVNSTYYFNNLYVCTPLIRIGGQSGEGQ